MFLSIFIFLIILCIVVYILAKSTNFFTSLTHNSKSIPKNKDNFLFYATPMGVNEKHNGKLVTFINVNELNSFFEKYDTLPLFANTSLVLEKNAKRINAKTLKIINPSGVNSTLLELSYKRPEYYNLILEYIDNLLTTGLEESISQAIEKINDKEYLDNSLKFTKNINDFFSQIKDSSIKERLNHILSLINEIDITISEKNIDNSKYRKIYFIYLPMLIEVLQNYINLENVSDNSKDLITANKKVLEICDMLITAINNITKNDLSNDLDNILVNEKTLKDSLVKNKLL